MCETSSSSPLYQQTGRNNIHLIQHLFHKKSEIDGLKLARFSVFISTRNRAIPVSGDSQFPEKHRKLGPKFPVMVRPIVWKKNTTDMIESPLNCFCTWNPAMLLPHQTRGAETLDSSVRLQLKNWMKPCQRQSESLEIRPYVVIDTQEPTSLLGKKTPAQKMLDLIDNISIHCENRIWAPDHSLGPIGSVTGSS